MTCAIQSSCSPPTTNQLWKSFAAVQAQIEADARAGANSVLFFYYSGHARSGAVDFGPEQVALSELRKRIEAMPTGLRVVVLDACQSGAISQMSSAIDFSTNSVSNLGMQGMAIDGIEHPGRTQPQLAMGICHGSPIGLAFPS